MRIRGLMGNLNRRSSIVGREEGGRLRGGAIGVGGRGMRGTGEGEGEREREGKKGRERRRMNGEMG